LNLPNGKYKLSFSVRNYPTNCTYILELKENDKINHNFELKPICPYKYYKLKPSCPLCQRDDKVLKIAYGLMATITKKGEQDSSENTSKVYEGGCVVSDCQPSWYCERDE